jgi:hypothetical protein
MIRRLLCAAATESAKLLAMLAVDTEQTFKM